ncbi:MAG: hypothetical protein HQK51_10165 [Oligoflexia bacterium]|nr:hypothetical protein [Oligoflexia bacterium]
MRVRYLVSIMVISLILLLGFILPDKKQKELGTTDVPKVTQTPKQNVAKNYRPAIEVKAIAKTTPSKTNETKIEETSNPKTWFSQFTPLNKKEEKEFLVVREQIGKFYDWGKVDEDALPAFRGTIGELGNRGVAHYVRKLATLTKDTVKTRTTAEQVIRELDTIRYLAENLGEFPLEAVKKLATRTIERKSSGEIKDSTSFQITLEAFQIYALKDPESALEFIANDIPEPAKHAYAYNYWLGRKLAGVSEGLAYRQITERLGENFAGRSLSKN